MQTFQRGDWVRVAKDLGPSMRHFPADCEAIVVGSCKDRYGGGKRESQIYTLYLKEQGQCSWYEENQLTLIEPGHHAKLCEWAK